MEVSPVEDKKSRYTRPLTRLYAALANVSAELYYRKGLNLRHLLFFSSGIKMTGRSKYVFSIADVFRKHAAVYRARFRWLTIS